MASSSPASAADDFGRLELPPLTQENAHYGESDIDMKSLIKALQSMGIKEEAIGLYMQRLIGFTKANFPSLLVSENMGNIPSDLSNAEMEKVFMAMTNIAPNIPASPDYDPIALPDIVLLPKDTVTKDVVSDVKYLLTCVRALGKSDDDIYRYLARQFILLCKKGGGHRHDALTVMAKLALFVLERKFLPEDAKQWFGTTARSSFHRHYVTWDETLTDAVNYLLIMAQETKVQTPLSLTETQINDMQEILLRLLSRSKEECATLYAELFWFESRFVLTADHPMLHPLNLSPNKTKHTLLEHYNYGMQNTPEKCRKTVLSRVQIPCVNNDFIKNGKLWNARIDATRLVETFKYSSKTDPLSLVAEKRFNIPPEAAAHLARFATQKVFLNNAN